MTDEQKDIAQHMREWYEVFRRHGKGDEWSVKAFLEAADLIEHLSSVAEKSSAKAALCEKVMEDYDKMRRERDRYWEYIKGMECESCSGDCDKCTVTKDGFTGWEWSGKEKAE